MSADIVNPFPGLRPFEPEEDHLFFGREREIDELLRRLRFHRFLAVVGTSGCGKSSLIRCGLISSLHGGMMAQAGSSWRVAVMRPGEDPIGHLAAALDTPDAIGESHQELKSTHRVLVEAALRRGPRGLVDAVRQARMPEHDRVLVVVDQFEELFRFQRSRHTSRDDATSFVKLLLEAAGQREVPLYVVITMRSDFIGDCMEFPGLPEALNASQYLVPRMTREALRSAITGPVAVAGATMAPRLALRLLNDLGSDHDQLPVLQHALMRTWDHWAARRQPNTALDVDDYEAVGTLRYALSLHAEEAYADASADQNGGVAEVVFKALTDTVSDPRGTRRPCSVAELAGIAAVPRDRIVRVVDTFRRPGRSFLMPPPAVPLEDGTVVDLSHESLMRCWTRLIAWADDERLSAAMYLRVSRAAGWHEEGSAGLWRDPELELGLQWRAEHRPTAAWAHRYGEPFDRAMRFLDRSAQERDRQIAERRAEKRRQWRQLQLTAVLLAVLLLIAATMAVLASRAGARAEANLRLARAAVDGSLVVAEREPSRLAADFPELVRFRQELLEQAQHFYRDFVVQAPRDPEIRAEMAFALLRLAHIDRALLSDETPVRYRQAIEQFEALVRDEPRRPEFRQALAAAYNWLGETLRLSGDRFDEARQAYDRALDLQQELMQAWPGEGEYQRDLARTFYNRGILHESPAGRQAGTVALAEHDFEQAIQLLQPLVEADGAERASQDLARAYNNLGSLLASELDRAPDAMAPYLRAVEIHERLLAREPDNREFAVELVTFYNNLAFLLWELDEVEVAASRNAQALALIGELARPAPSLAIRLADSHNLRGWILQTTAPGEALLHHQQAFDIYQNVGAQDAAMRLPEFHLRFGDLLSFLGSLSRTPPAAAGARALLSEALEFYLALARQSAATGSPAGVARVRDTLTHVLPALPADLRLRAETVLAGLDSVPGGGAASEQR